MRKLAMVTAAAVLAGGLALGGAPAGAATRRGGNESFCEALLDVSTDVDNSNPTGLNRESAEAIAKSLRRASKFAPRKVKKAMRRLAKLYLRIADGDDAVEVFANQRFLRDSVTYSTYYIDQCFGDVTAPTLDE
jgi:hypothetical protein